MTPLTCQQTEEHLDLFALDECEEPLRSAIAAHIASCAVCANSLKQARHLLGLLDIEFHDRDRRRRLAATIEAESRRLPPRRRVLNFPRQAPALAALLLVGIGLAWLTPGGQTVMGSGTDLEQESPRMKLAVGSVDALVWTSPRQPGYRVPVPFELKTGRRWVCVETTESEKVAAVITPAGTIRTSKGCFYVAVSPSGVVVVTLNGEVELTSWEGITRGQPGDCLIGRPDKPLQ